MLLHCTIPMSSVVGRCICMHGWEPHSQNSISLDEAAEDEEVMLLFGVLHAWVRAILTGHSRFISV